MIQTRLLLQKAGELGIGADVDVQVSAYLEYMRKEAGIPDMEGFDQVLRRQGSSLSELRRISREKYIQETVIYELVYANLTVLTPEIEEYYNANMSRFTVPAEVQLAKILLLTEGQDQTRVRSCQSPRYIPHPVTRVIPPLWESSSSRLSLVFWFCLGKVFPSSFLLGSLRVLVGPQAALF